VGADGPFENAADVGLAAAGGEGLAAVAATALVRRQVGRLGGGGQVWVAAAAVAGAAALLAAPPPGRHAAGGGVAGRRARRGRGVSQGMRVVVGLVAAAVKAVFEQAHLGFEIGEPLLPFRFASLDAGGSGGLRLRVDLSEALLELGFADGCAPVEGLVEGRWAAGVPECLLAGRQTTGGRGRRVEGASFHNRKYVRSAAQLTGR
jgi:hypothetical protein